MAQALGQVVDSVALDACAEPRGKHAIEIPADWIGAEIIVAVPARIVCARCAGGGCDGCRQRGGHRIEGDEEARAVRVKLPLEMNGAVVLRLVRPFGYAEGTIAQLHLETRIGVGASTGVELCALAIRDPVPGIETTTYAAKGSRHVALVVAAFFVLGVLAALSTMR
jgi:hypothetical protein